MRDTILEKKQKNYIEIGVALIQKGSQFLVAKRPKGKSFEGRWEFPGGKLEPLESIQGCLVREIMEEFGMTIAIQEQFKVWDYEYSNGKKFRFHSYLCEIHNGEPQLLWHGDMTWANVDELKTIDLLEADKELIPLIEKL